jgi:hypothetical protein
MEDYLLQSRRWTDALPLPGAAARRNRCAIAAWSVISGLTITKALLPGPIPSMFPLLATPASCNPGRARPPLRKRCPAFPAALASQFDKVLMHEPAQPELIPARSWSIKPRDRYPADTTMSAAPPYTLPFDADALLGPPLWGLVLAALLSGKFIEETILYWCRTGRTDRLLFRLCVGFMCATVPVSFMSTSIDVCEFLPKRRSRLKRQCRQDICRPLGRLCLPFGMWVAFPVPDNGAQTLSAQSRSGIIGCF